MKALKFRFPVVAAAALLVALGACSGGDSSDGANPPPPPVTTTGVVSVGVITGFGSVYVNGVRYDTNGVSVLMDDQVAAESALKVGQYVEVKGRASGGQHHADVIRYHNVLEGPIASIDVAASSFVAMGQTVRVTTGTSLGGDITPSSIEGLAAGDVVEVSGVVTTAGAIEATRVDIKPDGGPFEVTGYVTNLDLAGARFNINALVVDYSAASLADFPTGQPSEGDLVLVKGFVFSPQAAFVATRIELRSDDWLKAAAGDELEVEGTITEFVSAASFKVAGRAVTTTTNTTYEHGSATDLANDVLVEVKGTANADGTLVARKICFKEASSIRVVAQVGPQAPADGVIRLLGLVVATDEATRFEDMSALDLRSFGFADLAIGDWVDVRGYQGAAGSNAVIATRVVRIDPTDAVRLRGPFLDPARPAFHILSVPVATTDATRFVLEEGIRLTADEFFTQAVGGLVEAWGTWDGTVLAASRAEIKVDDD